MSAVIAEALEEKLTQLEHDRLMPGKTAWLKARLQELEPSVLGLTSGLPA